jgi:hypothetical protein
MSSFEEASDTTVRFFVEPGTSSEVSDSEIDKYEQFRIPSF